MELSSVVVHSLLILAAWIVLPIPLAVFVGKCIALGNSEEVPPRNRSHYSKGA